ncbi:MAG: hypothetical protein F6K55_43710 [Moorea sp. SIO4A3]|nr:hypothetical protein [Moorena sp. SIO4A3]
MGSQRLHAGVPPTRGLAWFPPLALCRGFPHSRFAMVPPMINWRGFPHSRFASRH